jgi:hypothetical protein
LVEPTSREDFVKGLTAAMLELATNPDRRTAMGEAGRRKAADEFDWQRKVDTILEIYKQTARNGRASLSDHGDGAAHARLGAEGDDPDPSRRPGVIQHKESANSEVLISS